MAEADAVAIRRRILKYVPEETTSNAPIELFAEGQALQAAGQSHIVHALIESSAKGHALQAAGQSHIFHPLVEIMAKG